MKYVFFLVLRATPAWLRLSREQRRAASARHLTPLFDGNEAVRMRYFDAEAFSAACSDVMMIETGDPKHYYFLIERMRDSPMFAVPYFEVEQIIPSIEDGYVEFEGISGVATLG